MTVKCKIKMTDKLSPVEGSVKGAEGKRTGTCPECLTPGVMLSIVGEFIRAHVVTSVESPENNPQAPTLVTKASKKEGTGLSEPMVMLTDTGVRIGDPREAEQRRTAEIEGATGTGTVKVPRKVQGTGTTKSGAPRMTTKMVDVPATEEHVREALDYWRKRNPRKAKDGSVSDAARKRQNDNVSALIRRLEALTEAQVTRYDETRHAFDVVTVPVADQPALSAATDTAQAHRGPTLVRGRDTAPRLRDPELSWDEPTDLRSNGEVRKTSTLDLPLGRERFDRKITDVPEPKRKRTPAERRRYRRMLKAGTGRQG